MELRHPAVTHKDIPVSADLTALLEWSKENGASFPKLKYPVEFPPGYPGALATAPISPQESFVTVPMRLLLNAEKADNSPIAPLFSEFPDVFQTHVSKDMFRLVSYIIHEIALKEESFWAPFLKVFPKDVEVLNDWTDKELDELEDYFLSLEVSARKKLLEGEWEVLKPALAAHPEWFPQEFVTYEMYYWLWKISLTRAFGRFKPSPSLIPVAEYVNHEFAYTHYIIGAPDSEFRGFPLFEDYDHPQLDPITCQEPYSLLTLAQLHIEIGQRIANSEAANDQLEMLTTWQSAMTAASQQDSSSDPAPAHNFTALDIDSKPEEDMVFRLVSGVNEYYEEGSQLFLFYGQYSNRQLLLNYGFTLPFNVYNFALVFLNLKQFANKFPRLNALTEAVDSPKFLVFKMRELQLCSGEN